MMKFAYWEPKDSQNQRTFDPYLELSDKTTECK